MGRVGRAITDRLTVLREMFWRPWVKVVGLFVFVLGLWSTVRAEFLSDEVAKNLQFYRIAKVTGGLVPLWVWIVVLASLIVAAAVEYSVGLGGQLASGSGLDEGAPEILDVKVFQHQTRQGMFDLFVPAIVYDRVAFRNDWELALRLANGRVVTGLRGETKNHSFPVPNTKYDMTVSFPFAAAIPGMPSLAGATVLQLRAVDIKKRKTVFEPVQGLPLLPCQDEASYPTGPIISVEITKEARWNTPNATPGLTPFLWGLKIRNDGEAADFQAWAELITGNAPLAPPGRRRLSFRDGVKARIFEGAEDRIFFAVVYWTSIYNSVIAKGLWYFDENQKIETDSQLFPTEPDGQETSASAVVVDLEITVASEPSMLLPWKRCYRLGPGNELNDITPSAQNTEVLPPQESAS